MIKANIDKNAVDIHVSGDPIQIAAEIGELIQQIYNNMKNQDTEGAEVFKIATKIACLDKSPVWTDDVPQSGTVIMSLE